MQTSPVNVGIIGLGVRGIHSIARLMAQDYPNSHFIITALCDRNAQRIDEALGMIQPVYQAHGVSIEPAHYTDGHALIDDPNVDFVVITSITDTHREFATHALQTGKKVYCDKPLAHNVSDAIAIVEAERLNANPLIMGFTRHYEAAWHKAYALLQEGAIGHLLMIQVRNIIPYHRYLTAWWRRREWSGGALNDKGSHLFDVFNWFSGSRAVRVTGYGGRSAIAPDPTAPERCSLCERECPFRRRAFGSAAPITEDMAIHAGESWLHEQEEKWMDDVCVYKPGADLYHNGSVQFLYDNGVIASYFFSYFGPEAEDQETLELVGSKGRIILNRHTGHVDLVTDYGEVHEVFDCRGEHFHDSHFGADLELVREMRRFADGAPPIVSARAGLEATRMVFAAFQSMDAGGVPVSMSEVSNAQL